VGGERSASGDARGAAQTLQGALGLPTPAVASLASLDRLPVPIPDHDWPDGTGEWSL